MIQRIGGAAGLTTVKTSLPVAVVAASTMDQAAMAALASAAATAARPVTLTTGTKTDPTAAYRKAAPVMEARVRGNTKAAAAATGTATTVGMMQAKGLRARKAATRMSTTATKMNVIAPNTTDMKGRTTQKAASDHTRTEVGSQAEPAVAATRRRAEKTEVRLCNPPRL